MAEYFPLIDRAVTGLPEATADARRSIYERARAALIGQLRKTEPPVPEEDIAREAAALDEAIARVEAKFTGRGPAKAPPSRDPPRPPPRLPTPRPLAGPPPVAGKQPPAPVAPMAPALPTGKAPPVAPPPSREHPVAGAAPSVAAEGRPLPPVQPRLPVGTRTARPTLPIRTAASGDAGGPRRERTTADDGGRTASLPPARDLDLPPVEAADDRSEADFAAALDEAAKAGPGDGADTVAPRVSPLPRGPEATGRPAAPRPAEARRFGWPAVALGAVVAVVMVAVGIAAWRMRDRPDQVVATKPVVQVDPAAPGKIVGRAPATPGTPPEGGAGGSSPASGTDPAAPPADGGATAGPAIPVAQRAALLVDAPDDLQRVKTYTGTVVWHLDSVSPGQGLPLAPAVMADIDLPDAKLKVTMTIQRNQEPQLPASHTIEIHFLPQAGYTLGNVTQLNLPAMRRDDDAPSGDPLTGVQVTIAENSFLVGLSNNGAAESQNLRLITERNWFDIGILLAPKRVAKLTFEKGVAGERVWEQAFAAWGDAKGASGGTP